MSFEIVVAGKEDSPVLRNLLQLYLYDVSDFRAREVNAEGLFEFGHLDLYGQEQSRRAFLGLAGGKPVSFVLVNELSVLSGADSGVRSIADLFVMRRYRRRGFGTRLALHVFRRMPGRWEVRQEAANEPAQSFWRRTVDAYTAGRFVELHLDDQRWNGPIQTFDNTLMLG